MHTALEFCARLVAETVATPDLASLSELDIIRRYPLIGLCEAALVVAGLACDIGLVLRLQRRPPNPLFQVQPKPWGLYELALVVLAYIGFNLLVFVASAAFHNDVQLAWIIALTSTLVMNLVFITALPWLYWRRGLEWRKLFGVGATRSREGLGYGVVLFLAMIPPLLVVWGLSAVLCQLLHIPSEPQDVVELLTFTDSSSMMGLVILLALGTAPVCEEVLFRGFAYPAFKQRYGTWKAVVLIAAIFALVHLNAATFGPLFALGVAFTLAYELTGSLIAPIVMHSLFNGSTVLKLLYIRAHP